MTSGTLSYGNSISNSGSASVPCLIKRGSGTLLLSGSNSYSGTTTVSAGVLQTAGTASLPGWSTSGRTLVSATGTLAVNYGGVSDWNQSNVDSLRGSATFSSGSFLGFDTTNASSGATYATNITGSPGYGVTKFGGNTLTLSGNDTYTGATTVNAGTLYLTGSLAANDDIQVANGATYQVLVSSTTSLSLYSRLATTDSSANKLNLVGAIINQDTNRTLDSQAVAMQWRGPLPRSLSVWGAT